MDVLDFWTKCCLDAYWKELVKKTQEVNFTGTTETEETEETEETDSLPPFEDVLHE
jgi:16S rRNA G527 N7-methylase RsmG